MTWVNYHSHSTYCDGKADFGEFISEAIRKGFKAYGFSSHSPVPFPSGWNMKASRFVDYLQEIHQIREKYAEIIEIYIGLEVDYIDGVSCLQLMDIPSDKLDFIIGSVHYIGKFPDGSYFSFDSGDSDNFFKGIEMIYHNDFKQAVKKYYESSILMVENEKPDIIGHMDKIKMHNDTRHYLDESEYWYRALIEDYLEAIRRKECIVEVNTKGLKKRNPPVLYPGEWVLRKIREKNIPVMINADAHRPGEIDYGFAETAELLLRIGFKTLRVLIGGKWQDCQYNRDGLII